MKDRTIRMLPSHCLKSTITSNILQGCGKVSHAKDPKESYSCEPLIPSQTQVHYIEGRGSTNTGRNFDALQRYHGCTSMYFMLRIKLINNRCIRRSTTTETALENLVKTKGCKKTKRRGTINHVTNTMLSTSARTTKSSEESRAMPVTGTRLYLVQSKAQPNKGGKTIAWTVLLTGSMVPQSLVQI